MSLTDFRAQLAGKTMKQAANMLETRLERAYKDLREAEEIAAQIRKASSGLTPGSVAAEVGFAANLVETQVFNAHDALESTFADVRNIRSHLR